MNKFCKEGLTPLSRFNFNIKKYPSIWLKGVREYEFSKNRYRLITNSITNFSEIANCRVECWLLIICIFYRLKIDIELYHYSMKKTPEKFREWIEKKIEVEFEPDKRNFDWEIIKKDVRTWQFWRYYEWMNMWREISKDWIYLRACIVIKTDTWNWLILVAPLTSKFHTSQTEYYQHINKNALLPKESHAIINQIKLIDTKRLSGIIPWSTRMKRLADHIIEIYIY